MKLFCPVLFCVNLTRFSFLTIFWLKKQTLVIIPTSQPVLIYQFIVKASPWFFLTSRNRWICKKWINFKAEKRSEFTFVAKDTSIVKVKKSMFKPLNIYSDYSRKLLNTNQIIGYFWNVVLLLNSFLFNVFILYPLKTPENLWFFGSFREYKMGPLARKWLS